MTAIWIAVGIAVGAVVTALAIVKLMPGMMIVKKKSRLGFDETVDAVLKGIEKEGWSSPGVMDMQEAMTKKGVAFPHRVKVVQLCKAPYAQKVLTSDRHMASLMPCAVAVYEDDNGGVHVAKMNTGLMGKLFGGTIAEVMGGYVAKEEHAILANVVAR